MCIQFKDGVEMCAMNGGLWPITWAVLIICITVYSIYKLDRAK